MILHPLVSPSLKFRLYARNRYPHIALLDYISGLPAGLGPGGGCPSEKRRETKKRPCLHIQKVVSERIPLLSPYKLPSTLWKTDPEHWLHESMTLHTFCGEYLNSASHTSASRSGFRLTTLHTRRANPNSSGHASRSKP